MRIKDLKEPNKTLALKRQKEFRSIENENQIIAVAFDWSRTPEGRDYWLKLANKRKR